MTPHKLEVRSRKSEVKGDKRSRIFYCLLPVACCLLLFAISGCASTSEMDAVRSSVQNVQVESLSQKKEIAQVKEKIAEISKDLNAFIAIKESQSSLLTQTYDFSKELQKLKGSFEENKYFMEKSIKELLAEKELQQARIAGLENEIKELKIKTGVASAEKKEAKATADTSAEKKSEPETKPADSADSLNPQRFYDDAQMNFREKRYAEARQKFEKFIKDFPQHAFVPSANYWIGESYYAEKKYEDAILAYETFLKKYPNHDKVRGAMLRQGISFMEMGDKKTAKVILEKVIEKYPRSAEADTAEKKIAEMLSKGNTQTKTKKKSGTKK